MDITTSFWECDSVNWLAKIFQNIYKSVTYIRGESDSTKTYAGKKAIDGEATKILNDYGNSILRVAYMYLHNMSDAEDVLQDTLVTFLKTAPSFVNAKHEKAWLLKVATNISKNKISYNKIRETDELSDLICAEEKKDLAFVWDAVKTLPVKYREVIHLYYYEGYSTAEVATLLKMKESNVRSTLHRGRNKLKEILKEVYDFE